MRFHLAMEADCPPNFAFYDCGGNSFRGCCLSNACRSPNSQCPRDDVPKNNPSQPTTVAAVAPPVMVSPAANSKLADKSTDPFLAPIVGFTTYFSAASTGGGAWYTDTKARPEATSITISQTPTPIQTQALATTSTTAAAKHIDDPQLSSAAIGGIIGGIIAVILAIVTVYFICSKRKRRLRSRESIDSIGSGVKESVEMEKGRPTITARTFQPENQPPPQSAAARHEDASSVFGGQYEEPQSRFSRVSDMSNSSKMMNHPVSPMSRDSFVFPTPAPAPSPSPAPSSIIARSFTASPDFVSRLGTATPELQGPPQQAAIAELASPGLPKVVEIHSSRSGIQKYKPYRPNTNSLYPVAETTPSYLTGTLGATQEERTGKKYVNSWEKWDAAA